MIGTLRKMEQEVKEAIEEALDRISFLTFEQASNDNKIIPRADIVYRISDGIQTKYLAVDVKSSGEPRYIRKAVQQLSEVVNRRNYDVYCMVAAPYISQDAGRICKDNRIGFIDLAGNCFFNFDKIYIERTSFPNIHVQKRTQRSILSKKATRILRVLLSNYRQSWQVQELAKESNVSIGLTYKVKERLLDLEFVEERDGYLVVARPQELLKMWAENYSYRKNKLYDYYSLKDLRIIESDLLRYCDKKQINYALALFSGAARVAPYTKYARGYAYIKGNIQEIAEALELQFVESGSNFTLMEPYDEGIFYGSRKMENAIVVSDIQLYLDLINFKGRGEEAAQFILEQKIKTQW